LASPYWCAVGNFIYERFEDGNLENRNPEDIAPPLYLDNVITQISFGSSFGDARNFAYGLGQYRPKRPVIFKLV
jgi:hypothetical protein